MKLESLNERAPSNLWGRQVSGRCLCGAVELEIDFPAFWAWHDHSEASRCAHGAAYATYIGCWRKHAHVVKGGRSITRFEDAKTESARSFCSQCGTPLLYERKRSPNMVNIPRALFTGRTGREPRYHAAIEELVFYPAVRREVPKQESSVLEAAFGEEYRRYRVGTWF